MNGRTAKLISRTAAASALLLKPRTAGAYVSAKRAAHKRIRALWMDTPGKKRNAFRRMMERELKEFVNARQQ